jgi:hypothetical protein
MVKIQDEANLVTEEQDEDVEENPEVTDELQVHPVEQEEEDDEEEEMNPEVPAEETPLSCSSPETLVDPEKSEMEQSVPKLVQENEYVPEDEPEAQYKEEEAGDSKEPSFFSFSLVPVQSEPETEAEARNRVRARNRIDNDPSKIRTRVRKIQRMGSGLKVKDPRK